MKQRRHHITYQKTAARAMQIACLVALAASSVLAQEADTLTELGRSGVFEIPMISDFNIDLSVGVGNAVNLTPRPQSGWYYGIVDCVAGDHFVINGKGGVVPRLWGFLDRNNILLTVADIQVTADRLRLTAPANASKLVTDSRAKRQKPHIPNAPQSARSE